MYSVILFGPSGVGKTETAKWLEEELGLLHISSDNHDGAGVDYDPIRDEWGIFSSTGNIKPLIKKIKQAAAMKSMKGIVFTCPSGWLLDPEKIQIAKAQNVHTIILYGDLEDIWSAYADRVKTSGQTPDRQRWDRNNRKYYDFGKPEYNDNRVYTFCAHKRKSRTEIVTEIINQIESNKNHN